MTEEKTIRQHALDFLKDSGFKGESLNDLELASIKAMGFAERNVVRKKGQKYPHEFTHWLYALLLREDLQKPDYHRELGALIINITLTLDVDFIRQRHQNDFLNDMKAYVENQREYLINRYGDNKAKIGYKFDKLFNRLKPLEITDKEIENSIKIALAIRGKINSIYNKDWREIGYESLLKLKTSEIFPNITVKEIEEMGLHCLIGYADGSINRAISYGMSRQMAEKIDKAGWERYRNILIPNRTIEHPQIQTAKRSIN